MERKLLGIINVNLRKGSTTILCIRKMLEKKFAMRGSSASAIYRLQESL